MRTTRRLRDLIAHCAGRLEHAAQLALLAARSRDPICGAEYLLDTLDDLRPALVALAAARRRHAP